MRLRSEKENSWLVVGFSACFAPLVPRTDPVHTRIRFARKQVNKEKEITMKRSITYAAIGFGLLLPYLSQPAFSQTIPTADTKNAGPAAAAIEGITYVAW